jgi:DNA modification methylase
MPEEYVARLAGIFAEVRRLLVAGGTLWLNLGDTYAAKARGTDKGWDKSRLTNPCTQQKAQAAALRRTGERHRGERAGIKNKDLCMIPARVALALQEDGWYLRSQIVWSKSNPMPESVTDRPTTSHEFIYLLAKNERYYFDQEAVREPAEWERWGDQTNPKHEGSESAASWIGPRPKRELVKRRTVRPGIDTNGGGQGTGEIVLREGQGRNVRSVWEIATRPYPEAHFAVFPPELPRRCILAGVPEGGVVLDPFVGSGTTAVVARQLGRRAIGIDLNAAYLALAAERLGQQSLFAEASA